MMSVNYRIGMAARMIGINESTLRNLEKNGVIPPARRDWAGYRVFSLEELTQIEKRLFYGNQDGRHEK